MQFIFSFDFETQIFYIGIFAVFIIISFPFSHVALKILDGFGKSQYSLLFIILRVTTQIAIIILLEDIFSYVTCVLIGLTAGVMIFACIYYIFLRFLLRRYAKNIDGIAVV